MRHKEGRRGMSCQNQMKNQPRQQTSHLRHGFCAATSENLKSYLSFRSTSNVKCNEAFSRWTLQEILQNIKEDASQTATSKKERTWCQRFCKNPGIISLVLHESKVVHVHPPPWAPHFTHTMMSRTIQKGLCIIFSCREKDALLYRKTTNENESLLTRPVWIYSRTSLGKYWITVEAHQGFTDTLKIINPTIHKRHGIKRGTDVTELKSQQLKQRCCSLHKYRII